MDVFDLIVLGGGPAGYVAAERAAAGGLKTALFEMRSLGGVCLNEGCIPTKAMLYSAKMLAGALHGEAYGLRVAEASLDHGLVMKRKAKVVRTLVSGVAAKMKACGVTVVPHCATVAGKAAQGFAVRADGMDYAGKRLLAATGSEAVVPPIPGLRGGMESGYVHTSREMLDIEAIPKELVIVGGGIIGLELACYFNAAGSKVTVVEMLDKIAGATESEISEVLLKNMRKKGVQFRLGCKVEAILPGRGVQVSDMRPDAEKARAAAEAPSSAPAPASLAAAAAGLAGAFAGAFAGAGTNAGKRGAAPAGGHGGPGAESEVISADKVLLCIGRKPRASGFGLDSVGVCVERGAILTDAQLRTNIPGVYAAGDVNGKSMLAHTAYREAEVAVGHMLGNRDAMRYGAIPSVIYTSPEAACVGETQESAAAKGIPAKSAKLSMRYAGRYVAEDLDGDGVCKLVADGRTGRLLGAHVIGSYASEIIVAAGIMIESRLPLDELRKLVFPHPTVGEIIRETLFAL
jgi:dihydrolipoamide dehydrogenase